MEFEQILKLVDHVSASHLESFCYEGDGVKLTLNNKIAQNMTKRLSEKIRNATTYFYNRIFRS